MNGELFTLAATTADADVASISAAAGISEASAAEADRQLAVVTHRDGQLNGTDCLAVMKRQGLLLVSASRVGQTDRHDGGAGVSRLLLRSFQIDPHDGRRSQDDGPRPNDVPCPFYV